MNLTDIEIETGFVLTLLEYPGKIEVAKDVIAPSDLDNPFYQNIYSGVLRIVNSGKKIAQGNLHIEIGADSKKAYDNINLRKDLVCIESFEDYVDAIHKRASIFKAKNKFSEVFSKINGDNLDLNEILSLVQRNASDVTQIATANSNDVGYADDIIDAFKLDLEERISNEDDISGLRTGLVELDDALNGLLGGQYIVIAGRPAMGKTAIALNMMENILNNGGSALIFSMEMRKHQLMYRMIANQGDVLLDNLRRGRLTEREAYSMAEVIKNIRETWDLRVVDKGGLPFPAIKNYILKEHHRKPLDIVMIDYLQLMSLAGTDGDNKNDKIGEISKSIKALALDLNIPIVVLSQLSRDVEKRANKRPVNSDLRDSGAIEQDADVILFPYRDEVYNEDTEDKGIAEIIIGKQREGEAKTVKSYFEGHYSRFRSMITREELEARKMKQFVPAPEEKNIKKVDAFDDFDVSDDDYSVNPEKKTSSQNSHAEMSDNEHTKPDPFDAFDVE